MRRRGDAAVTIRGVESSEARDLAAAFEQMAAASARAHLGLLDLAYALGAEPETPFSREVEREAFMRGLDEPLS